MKEYDATLYLEGGERFDGFGFGDRVDAAGEVVFHTAMSGYSEIAADPVCLDQIVVFTFPEIEFVGKAAKAHPRAMIVGELHGVPLCPGISGVDTRQITRIVREAGSKRGVVVFWRAGVRPTDDQLVSKLRSSTALSEPIASISTGKAYRFGRHSDRADARRVVVYDYGTSRGLLGLLAELGLALTVVPYNFDLESLLELKPAAVVLSDGPGDPEAAKSPVESVRQFVGRLPILALGVGHQILALAIGGKTLRLEHAHRSLNHPVRVLSSGKALISSHNHGFAVDMASLPGELSVSYVSLHDGTLEGYYSDRLKIESVQFQPQSHPGPNDSRSVFDQFFKRYL